MKKGPLLLHHGLAYQMRHLGGLDLDKRQCLAMEIASTHREYGDVDYGREGKDYKSTMDCTEEEFTK